MFCTQGLVLVYVTVVLVVMARQFRFLNNIDQVYFIHSERNFVHKAAQDQDRMAVVDSKGATGLETIRSILSEPNTLV